MRGHMQNAGLRELCLGLFCPQAVGGQAERAAGVTVTMSPHVGWGRAQSHPGPSVLWSSDHKFGVLPVESATTTK